MRWFDDLRMAPKLMASFLLIATLTCLVGGIGLAALGTTHDRLARIVDGSVPGLVRVLKIREDTSLVVRYTGGMILATDLDGVRRYDRLASDARADIGLQLARYDATITPGEPREAGLARGLRTLLDRWLPLNARIARLAAWQDAAANVRAARLSVGPEAELVRLITGSADALAQLLQAQVTVRMASAEEARWVAVRQLCAAIIGAVLLALALSALLARSIAGPLHRLSDTATAIARGDTGARIDVDRRDELGALASALRAMVADLQGRALTDHVTGLGNHRAYQEAIHRAVANAVRRDEPVALALIDLDDFKVLNDQHGHAQGDRVLRALGSLLRAVRAGDGAFHLGGDEFALLLPAITENDATVALERLRRESAGRLSGASVSVGIAARAPGEQDMDADALRERGDAALYAAKRRGRNAVVTFEEIRDTAAVVSPAKVHAVRHLLEERAIGVVFQPIWDLQRGQLLAVEALVRPAPGCGLAGPAEAFDIAEKLDRAHDLDALCHQVILERAESLPSNVLLFFNLTPQTLEHGMLEGATLADAVTRAGLTPERVVLEITERAVTRPAVVVREAHRLRALGFWLALDDVGAGNAGLEMLRQVPVDYLKIDRSVVVGARTDNTARSVLAALIAFARQSGTFVIAEGIETEEMLAFVRRMGTVTSHGGEGVHGVQGYLLGRPSESMPALLPVPRALCA